MALKIDNKRAAELEALDEAATPGPWQVFPALGPNRFPLRVATVERHPLIVADGFSPAGESDATLVAESRNAIAPLLSDRRTLLDALRQSADLAASLAGTLGMSADWALPDVARFRALLASAEGGRSPTGLLLR